MKTLHKRSLAYGQIAVTVISLSLAMRSVVRSDSTPTAVSVQVPHDATNDANVVAAVKTANALVPSFTGLVGSLEAFAKDVADKTSPRAGHQGISTVEVTCLLKGGRVTDLSCKNVDGSGFSIECPDGKISTLTTLEKGKPDGFWIDISPLGLLTLYCELHDGLAKGMFIQWDDNGKRVESRKITVPQSLQSLIQF